MPWSCRASGLLAIVRKPAKVRIVGAREGMVESRTSLSWNLPRLPAPLRIQRGVTGQQGAGNSPGTCRALRAKRAESPAHRLEYAVGAPGPPLRDVAYRPLFLLRPLLLPGSGARRFDQRPLHYGEAFAASVSTRSLHATQFHPEKSQSSGLTMLEELSWEPSTRTKLIPCSAMLLLPAIDLMDGQVVRLKRGLAAEKTVYSNDPVAFARKWEDAGADWLHLVDLDAAFERHTEKPAVTSSASARPLRFRASSAAACGTPRKIRDAFSAGVRRVILGTRASESIDFVRECMRRVWRGPHRRGNRCEGRPCRREGMDRNNAPPGRGPCPGRSTRRSGNDHLHRYCHRRMLEGPNYGALRELLEVLDCDLIASGGVTTLEDLKKLASMAGLHGAIIGKSTVRRTNRSSVSMFEIIRLTILAPFWH